VRGSGNVYRNFGRPNAGLKPARAAENLTGVSHSEFSRIRNAQLRRFTFDGLYRLHCTCGLAEQDGPLSAQRE